ncbi:hypothetical protein M0R01_04405 [bacterium]|jgi:hypothetical protein|nr:hypothetical protein [bacterium]
MFKKTEKENLENKEAIIERTVEHIMIGKIQLLIAIIVFMCPVIGCFFKIQMDVALIKQNHEAHIQTAIEEIRELKEGEKDLQIKLDTDHEAIIKLMTINNLNNK